MVEKWVGEGNPRYNPNLSEEQRNQMATLLNWTSAPFEIPNEILSLWNNTGNKYKNDFSNWTQDVNSLSKEKMDFLKKLHTKEIENLDNIFTELKQKFISDNFAKATRNANGEIIESITPHLETLIGGTADLGAPTCTINKFTKTITSENFNGNFIE